MRTVNGRPEQTLVSASWKRVVGASFFGLISAAYVQNAASQTIPHVIAMGQKMDMQSAVSYYEDSALIRTTVLLITAFAGSLTAGFLARQRGPLVGILTNSPYLALLGYMVFVSATARASGTVGQLPMAGDLTGDTAFMLGIALRFALLLLVSLLGGALGQRLYSPEIDPDWGHERLTIFGVRWPHYFWILPLIYLAFLASAIIVVYAAIVVFVADWSFAWYPSLWLNPVWWVCFPLGALAVYAAGTMTVASFVRFFEVMRDGQTRSKGWGKVGRALMYGVGAPALSYTIAAIGADIAHAMPKPISGDWKVAVGIAILIAVVSTVTSIYSRVSKRG